MEMIEKTVKALIPEVFAPLMTQKWRIKFYYGGRAGGKSYAFADSILLLGRTSKLFIACVREIQDSIKDSVYKLLVDRIGFYELNDYKIFEDRIENLITGTRFIFKGLREQDSQKIKSLEGVDVCWIEEAQTISKKSWEILEPTIRKAGSEIWISMNRLEETDPIWKAVAAKPDERTLLCKVNYYDNPFCPEEMRYLAKKCKEADYDLYQHIWLGSPQMQGNTKLISAKPVREAMVPKMDTSTSPLIIGLDIARFGDDKTTFFFRKGRWCYKFEQFAKLDNVEVANVATNYIRTLAPHRIFMDIGGCGAGVYDVLKARGYAEIIRGIGFAEKAIRSDRYANRRAEIWGEANEWLNSNMPVHLVDDDGLFEELVSVNKKYDSKGRLQLEDKDEVKKRLGRSPDKADAFCLTFAEPVYDFGRPKLYGSGNVSIEDMFADSLRQRSESQW